MATLRIEQAFYKKKVELVVKFWVFDILKIFVKRLYCRIARLISASAKSLAASHKKDGEQVQSLIIHAIVQLLRHMI